MKKLITAMLALAAIAPLSAQQLPNNGFEDAWVAFKPFTTGKTGEIGTAPTEWSVSNTYGMGGIGKLETVKQVEGYNSASAPCATNGETGLGNIKKTVPGYFTLGTAWSTSKGMFTITNTDGGTFGGIEFAYSPDAITCQYQATGDKPTVVAYAWKGTFIQKNVPAEIASGTPKTVAEMLDRDRNILDMTTAQGGEVTQKGTLIASNSVRPAVAVNWTEFTMELNYVNSETPEKFNVIFSAGDYFNSAPVKDHTMTVDDVKLLYYSRLKTLSVNGTEVTLEKDKYDYDLSASVYMPKSAEEISYTLLGESPAKTVSVALDAENNTTTITVKNTNEGATDVDGKAEHVYTIKFKAPDYSRLKTLSVSGNEVQLEDGVYDYDLSASVYMPKNVDAFSYTVMGESSAVTVDIALDAENNTATITVKNTNEGATDVDGEAEHVYTIKFKAPRVFTGIEYPGHITTLTWNVDGSGHTSLIEEPVKASVWMTKKGLKRIVDVLLPDFTLPGIGTIGDILVENVTRTYNNNNGNPIYDYIGHVDDLSLAEGGIHAIVDLEGTSDIEGNVNFKIHVKWVQDASQSIVAREAAEPAYIPIEVEFNGKTATPEVPTGINDVTVDGADAPVEYFDLQGIRVSYPQAGRMVIRRQGTNVEKILVK